MLPVYTVWQPQPRPAFIGAAWSKLPTHKRWSTRVQGSITAQQWELLASPWKLAIHQFWTALAMADWLNTTKARSLTKQQRRRLNRAHRRAITTDTAKPGGGHPQ